MAAQYTLRFFKARGNVEVCRLMFAQAAVDFKDVTYDPPSVDRAAWEKIRPGLKFERVPVLEFGGHVISQFNAIAHYLARTFGMVGADATEEAMVWEVFFTAREIEEYILKFLAGKLLPATGRHCYMAVGTPEIMKWFEDEELARLMGALETMLAKRDFFVGTKVTAADLMAFVAVDGMMRLEREHRHLTGFVQRFPRMMAFHERIARLPHIAKYLAARPDYKM